MSLLAVVVLDCLLCVLGDYIGVWAAGLFSAVGIFFYQGGLGVGAALFGFACSAFLVVLLGFCGVVLHGNSGPCDRDVVNVIVLLCHWSPKSLFPSTGSGQVSLCAGFLLARRPRPVLLVWRPPAAFCTAPPLRPLLHPGSRSPSYGASDMEVVKKFIQARFLKTKFYPTVRKSQ